MVIYIYICLWISNPLQTRICLGWVFGVPEKLGVFIFLERKGERPASCRGGRAKWREAKRRSISKRKRKGEGGTQETFLVKKCHDLSNPKKRPFFEDVSIVSEYLPFFTFGDSPPCHQHVSWRATCGFFSRKPCPSIHRVWIHQHPMQSRRAARMSYNNKSHDVVLWGRCLKPVKTLRITL